MKGPIKIILSLLLVLAFVMACFVIFIITAFAGWLHTYRTFTQKELAAVIEVQGQQVDEDGDLYTNIKYKPIKDKSALTSIFSSRENNSQEYDKVQEYKVYGDQIEIGGDFVKFSDHLNLLGVKNIYKVTRLEGDYTDPEKAANIPQGKRTVVGLNGGTDDYWKYFQENSEKVDFFIDSVYGSYSSKFVRKDNVVYGLYVTEDGFMLDELEQ